MPNDDPDLYNFVLKQPDNEARVVENNSADDCDGKALYHYNLEARKKQNNDTRRAISLRLLWVILGLSFALVVTVVAGLLKSDSAKDLGTLLVAPLVAVFCTTVGYYFGGMAE